MNIKTALFALARDFSVRMQKKNMQSYASSTAFFLIVSLIPMLILFFAFQKKIMTVSLGGGIKG